MYLCTALKRKALPEKEVLGEVAERQFSQQGGRIQQGLGAAGLAGLELGHKAHELDGDVFSFFTTSI